MNKFAMASKKLLLFVISGLFILSIASSIAYLLTQELIVAATSVTFESTQSNTAYNGVDEVIENFNIDADANFAVVTVVYRQSPSAEVVTYVDVNAQEASFGCRESDADYAVELWYVANPSTGSVPVNVVWSGATNDIVINVTSFSGVDTTNPVRSSACASSQGVWSNTASVTIASNPDDLVFGAWNGYLGFVFAGNSTPNAGTTEIWEEGNVNTFTNGGYRESTSASETVSWTYTGDPTPWAIAAISIVPQAVVSNDFNVSLIDNTDSFQITATRTSGTATVSALEYRVNGGSWVSLDDSGGGGFGTSSATSGLVDKQTLGAPGNYTVDYRALGSDGLYYPQPAGFGTQTVNVPNPPTYEDIQVLNVFTEAYPYAAAGYPINSSQPLDPDDNATYAILAVAHRMDAGQTVTSASWGGVNFTQLASCESDDYSIDLWGLANPNVGSNGGDIQFSSDATEVISALTFLGNVDTTNPIYAAGCEDTQDNNALWSNNPSITLTSKNGYYMFGAWNGYLGFISNSTPNSGTTEIWEEGNINTFTNGGYRESTSTSDTLSWTYTGDPTPWAIAAVVLKPTESTGSGSGEIDLNVSVDNSGGNFQITANATGSLTVSSLEYSYDGGNTWNAIPDSFSSLVSGGYGTSSVVYQVDNYAIPDAGLDEFDNPQYYPVSVRAIDNNDNVWPASGYVEVLDIDGLGNGIEFVLYKNENGSVDDGLGFSVRHLAGVNISSVEYRIDSGSWVNYESSQVGSTEVEGGLFFVDLPTGNHTFQVRATDENGVLWPLQNLYSFAQISFDEGLYEGPRVLSDLDFNSSVGEFAINSGEFISTNVTDDQVLPSEQGVYKWVDVVGSTGGRVRISDSTFTNDGSAGALTFDGFGDDSSIETITTETKVYVPENFNFTNNLYLTFEFTWHDNFVSNFEAQEQNGNKLYLDIDGVLYEIFDFYANGSGQTGVTQQINIDLDQALASAGYTESDYLLSSSDPYLLFRIESSFAREAQDKNGTEGFTIDNFRIYHSFDGTISEDSLPKLSMDANLFRSAKRADIYSGIVNERLFVVGSDEISGTALDEDSSISSIRLELYGQDDLLLNTILATPVDGAFDSSTEIYEIVLDDTNLVENGPSESVSKYALAKIIVEDAVGNTNFYEFTQGFSYLSSDSLNLLVGSSDRRTVGINEVYDVRFVVEKEVTNQDPLVSFVASTDLQFDFCSFSVDFGYNFEPANVIDSADGDTCEVDFSILDFDKYAGEIILRFTLAPESFDQPTISGVFTILTLNGQQAIYDTTAGAPINSNQFEPTFILNNLGVQPINQNQVTYTGTAYGNEDYGFTVANVQYAIWTGFYEVNWTDAIPSDGSFNEYEEDFYFQTPPLIDGEKIVFIRVFGSNGVEFYSGILGDVGAPADRVNIDAVDTSTPIIELQPVLPNPTADSSPIISGSVGDDESELTSNIALIEYSTNGVDFTPITPADGLYDEKEEQFKFKLEDLAPGDYQVWVRARDASGNVTAGDQIKSVSFTVIERQEVDAVKVSKQSDFNSYIDYDSVLSENVIWGRGQLRLKEDVSVASKNLLVPTNNGRWGNRYKRDAGSQLGFEYSSCGNGLFLNQAGPNFAYYDLNTNTEYQFDLTDVGLASSDFTQGMASFQTPIRRLPLVVRYSLQQSCSYQFWELA
ncbi:MAG: hypothetical protein KatS3mg086_141 [Candidatus Dojkabacteria bacterium]|nr:MAG: hypothetical protein KatS3mg086_141 [Candidatus Dojkabacteria bacterium]